MPMPMPADPSADHLESAWHPATPAQQGIWILDRIERLRPSYLVPSVIEFRGPVEHEALVDATRRALARHPALRSRFRLDLTRRRVEYRTDGEPSEVGLIDVAADGWSDDELAELVEALCYTPFELADEAPARAEVIRIDDGVTLLVITVHHIVFDGTSRRLLLDEIAALYQGAVLGHEVSLSEPVHPAAARPAVPEEEVADQIASAVRRLRGAPTTVELPYDRAPDDELSMIGKVAGTTFDEEVTAKVMAVAAQEGCTAFMVGVAVLAGTLARLGAQRDFLFAVVWPGRDDPASADAIGMFMTTLVLRVTLDETTTWRELLAGARTAGMETFIDADVPLDALAAELDAGRGMDRLPLSPVLVNMAEVPDPVELAPGVVGRYRPLDPQYSKWDLALFVHVDDATGGDGARLELSFDYPAGLFTDATINDLLVAVRRSVADIAQSPEDIVIKPVAEQPNLDDPAERLELVRSIWREVLDVEDVEDDVSFFDAGGDSLRMLVLVERLCQASGRVVKTVDLFRAGTVRGQADLLAASGTAQAGGAQAGTVQAGGAQARGSSRERLLEGVRSRRSAGER